MKVLNLEGAQATIEDYRDDHVVDNLGSIQVDVSIGEHSFSYQTTNTVDGGSQSAQLGINIESGAFDSLLDFLVSQNVEIEDEEDVYAYAKDIGEQLRVQEIFDKYVSEIGTLERKPNSMDANSSVLTPFKYKEI